ncbi:MAG: AarF/UbiB family protein, partial [Rickettsiales bacterium]
RPDIRAAFARDLELFLWIAGKIETRFPEFRRLRPLEMVATLAASVEFELDLRYEAAAAEELKQNMASEPGIFIPAIDWLRTSGEVLTLERINGTPMNDILALRKKGFDFDALIKIAANAFFQQVFRDGFFHADMHPGNLFVLDDGRIAAIDCGIMGRLDLENRIFLAQVLQGFLTEDYETVARVHVRFGIVPPHKSIKEFAQACRAIGKPILDKPLNEISIANLLGQLFKVSKTFEMVLQPQFLLLQKTMMLTEGIGRALNPNINMWKLSEPLITEWGHENLTPRALLKHKVKKTIRHLVELPEVMEKFDLALEKYLADQEPKYTTKHTTH